MAKDKGSLLRKDLADAMAAVMKSHGLMGQTLSIRCGPDQKGIVVTIAPTNAALPSNSKIVTKGAITRYTENMHRLGLPTRGTKIALPSGKYTLMGLSSDGKRVKAMPSPAGNGLMDLPTDIVVAHVSNAAAKRVAALDANDVVESVAEAAAVINGLFKKPGGIA